MHTSHTHHHGMNAADSPSSVTMGHPDVPADAPVPHRVTREAAMVVPSGEVMSGLPALPQRTRDAAITGTAGPGEAGGLLCRHGRLPARGWGHQHRQRNGSSRFRSGVTCRLGHALLCC
jgi:hypothetical protein